MARDEPTIYALRKIVIDGFLLSGLILCLITTNLLWYPFQRGFFCGDESLMFPYKTDTVTVPMLRIFGLGLPLLAILICEFAYLRKERATTRCLGVRVPAWIRGVYCTSISFAIGVCFTELTAFVAKNTIGRPRPHFFEVCKPSVDCSAPEWQKRYIEAGDYRCTSEHTDLFREMRMSFLSGHSSWAAYTMIFFVLYLEKRMVWSGTRLLRHTLQFIAVMMSWFTALSRVSDYKHHWSDVLAGYFMGATVAVLVWTHCTDLVKKRPEHTPMALHDVTLHHQPQQITAESA